MINLIVGCSQKKLKGKHKVIDLYRGALWNIIRKNYKLHHFKFLKIYAISAKHGLILCNKIISNYDLQLTENKIVNPNQVFYLDLLPKINNQIKKYNINKSYICCGKAYNKLLQKCNIKIVSISKDSDGIGKKGTKLKNFLLKIK